MGDRGSVCGKYTNFSSHRREALLHIVMQKSEFCKWSWIYRCLTQSLEVDAGLV